MKIRHTLAVIPAIIFWGCSAVFFVMGLSMDDHTGLLFYIACALALANTIVQLIGWDSHPDELGPLLYYTWIASYVLGIGTNMVSLLKILEGMDVAFLRWMVAGALSYIIEVSPERLFILAWRSVVPKTNGSMFQPYQGGEDRRSESRGQGQNKQQGKKNKGHVINGQTPQGQTRAEYLRQLKLQEMERQAKAMLEAQQREEEELRGAAYDEKTAYFDPDSNGDHRLN